MTVGEMIKSLQEFPEETNVRIHGDHGQVYMLADEVQEVYTNEPDEWMMESVFYKEDLDGEDTEDLTKIVVIYG